MNLFVDIVGWAGSAAVLMAYGLVSSNRLRADSASYQILNLLGSIGLIINSAFHAAYPSTVLNVIWTGIAAVSLVKLRSFSV